MKKIMFNDRFNLTKLVLGGRKTQTRRLELDCNIRFYLYNYEDSYPKIEDNKICIYSDDGYLLASKNTRYKIGEEVAIAQAYNDFFNDEYNPTLFPEGAGWTNKLFVKAELMPYRIRITNVKVERLQDISDDACLKEGVVTGIDRDTQMPFYGIYDDNKDIGYPFAIPSEAFAFLIDKVSGRGTWGSNPWVLAYEFELIK